MGNLIKINMYAELKKRKNKSLRLSSSFYAKNYDIDKSKIPILEKIKELMMSNRIKDTSA